ncbi:uncharacterized protein M421DRAFT_363702 [Didymella exigua CBS 183.55]|uniref:Uncharacterized protein n=1 Tax=Didymella exigua CBS 183.55 TaxID=1150837 RepID=A0A6A5RUD5_9PLEO|nr:uncharacterized protein M421DRAFT_363702 [Didymella exigua CBS 183.55]KAF1930980.1 hypothetical protein M421DRAFT_363702 [Didymella exigua CBS 183.55]
MSMVRKYNTAGTAPGLTLTLTTTHTHPCINFRPASVLTALRAPCNATRTLVILTSCRPAYDYDLPGAVIETHSQLGEWKVPPWQAAAARAYTLGSEDMLRSGGDVLATRVQVNGDGADFGTTWVICVDASIRVCVRVCV